MARMPGAVWRPLPLNASRMSRYDGVCLHTMVGSLDGTDSYFRGHSPGGTNSHFGTGPDGTIYQWVDTAYRSAANLNGNHRLITVENADVGTGFPKWNLNDGSAVPAFTDAQVEANARIIAWAHKEHGTRIDLMPNTLSSSKGTCYHRMGIDPYRVAGGERWSNATGKVCPGNRRIAQIPQIIARAKQLVAGGSSPVSPMPEFSEDEDMTPEQAKQLQYVYDRLTEKEINGGTLPTAIRQLHETWVTREHNRAGLPSDHAYPTGRAITLLRYADGNAEVLRQEMRREIDALQTSLDQVRAAVAALAPGS